MTNPVVAPVFDDDPGLPDEDTSAGAPAAALASVGVLDQYRLRRASLELRRVPNSPGLHVSVYPLVDTIIGFEDDGLVRDTRIVVLAEDKAVSIQFKSDLTVDAWAVYEVVRIREVRWELNVQKLSVTPGDGEKGWILTLLEEKLQKEIEKYIRRTPLDVFGFRLSEASLGEVAASLAYQAKSVAATSSGGTYIHPKSLPPVLDHISLESLHLETLFQPGISSGVATLEPNSTWELSVGFESTISEFIQWLQDGEMKHGLSALKFRYFSAATRDLKLWHEGKPMIRFKSFDLRIGNASDEWRVTIKLEVLEKLVLQGDGAKSQGGESVEIEPGEISVTLFLTGDDLRTAIPRGRYERLWVMHTDVSLAGAKLLQDKEPVVEISGLKIGPGGVMTLTEWRFLNPIAAVLDLVASLPGLSITAGKAAVWVAQAFAVVYQAGGARAGGEFTNVAPPPENYMRQEVSQMLEDALGAAIRALVLENRHKIEGIDLARLFQFDLPGEAPAEPPAD